MISDLSFRPGSFVVSIGEREQELVVKYLLLICGDESAAEHATEGCGGWTDRMRDRGTLSLAAGLAPVTAATTVQVRDHAVLLSDGPFAETKDQVGGICLIDCADLDEAIEVASQHPAAQYGKIEIRPLWQA